ncbi:MAG: metallophosphoesterase [Planctomycetota bacterium]|nr:metallophosphoesterase [Planctomycetota bacterium]
MKWLWATDIHLNTANEAEALQFYESIRQADADALIITGDIATGPGLARYLRVLEAALRMKIYFVLGNHDYYYDSIAAIRNRIPKQLSGSPYLSWLADSQVVPINSEVTLVGHGAWGDARLGPALNTPVRLNDHVMIEELAGHSRSKLVGLLNDLGAEAAEYLSKVISKALETSRHVLVATHVPPFREAAWYQGEISDDNWLPHFSCAAVGEILLKLAQQNPDKEITVLCGHTHGRGYYEARENLRVHTGGAVYRYPQIEAALNIEGSSIALNRQHNPRQE